MTKDNKTLGVRVRFWTNKLEVSRDGELYKSCWDSGVVSIEANKEKGITSQVEVFQKFDEIGKAIEKVLKKQKVLMVKEGKPGRIK